MKRQTRYTCYLSLVLLCVLGIALLSSYHQLYGAPLEQETPAVPAQFVDISERAGIQATHTSSWDEYHKFREFTDGYLAMGQAWGDYDNDGWVDLYVTGGLEPSVLYRNRGDGTFVESTHSTTVSLPDRWTGGAVWADYDNDGWRDLYVLAHGANVLFHNDGGTGFTDVTESAGVGDRGNGTTATWGDFNADGFLDLYVTNWSCYPACDPVDNGQAQDRLYQNNGDGSFTDVSALLTYEKLLGAGFAATFVDIDDDRDPDLYVVNDKLQNPIGNVLWRNDGPDRDGTCGGWCWTDISESSGADSVVHGMGLAIGDYDEDLDLDFYFTNMVESGQLLKNDGQGGFFDATTEATLPTGLSETVGWGTAFFDYDNDSHLDLYYAATRFVKFNDLEGPLGMHYPLQDFLFHNEGGTYSETTPPDWQDNPQPTMGVAYADYDGDGLLDLVSGTWNEGYHLHHNEHAPAAENNWLRVQLIGGGPVNRDAVGTRVYLNLTGGRRLMQEVVNGSAMGAGNELTLHFGLGQAKVVSALVIWPNGLKRLYPIVPHNQLWRVAYPGMEDDPLLTQIRKAAPDPFVDVSAAAGITARHQGNWAMFKPGFTSGYLGIGQAWGDYDGDGWIDLYVTGNELPNVLYHNKGDGTFEISPFSDSVSLPNTPSGGVVWADYNNDGRKDLYVLNQGANTLFRNDGNGFTDVTASAGVGDTGKGSSATWGDYDGDSFLDLYVVNWSCHPECDPIDLTLAEDRLYHNNGDGTFTDVSSLLVAEKLQGAGFTASFGDFDDDGDPDLYVVNDALMNPIGNVYWRNDGPDTTGSCANAIHRWCWTDASAENGAGTVVEGMGLAIGDYDNDLDLDFYYSNMVNPSELLQNLGEGTFTDVAENAGVDTINGATVGWGASFLDYDNDGWLDLFMATTEFRRSDPNQPPDGMHFGHPNLLFHNNGAIAGAETTFTNVTPATWYEVPRSSMGIAYADYDRDGRVDFVTGDWNQGYVLYRNVDSQANQANIHENSGSENSGSENNGSENSSSENNAANNWFAAQLIGAGPVNRDAAGARIYLTDSSGKIQLREVRIGSSLGAGEDTDLYFGLGTATIDQVEIHWPDGKEASFENLSVNQRWTVTYPDHEGTIVALPTPTATPAVELIADAVVSTTTVATTAPMTPTSMPAISPTVMPVTMPTAMPTVAPLAPVASAAAAQPMAPADAGAARGMVSEGNAQLATAWFTLYPHLIETTEGFTPPVAARAIGYGSVAFYEALVPGLPGYQSLTGQLNGLSALPTPQPDQRYHWPTVANSAMANITRMLFANTTDNNLTAIALLELQFAEQYRPLLDAATFNRSVQLGRAMAVSIYGWSVTDGGHEGQLRNFPADYVLPVGDGLWQTTPPAHATALQPYWGSNRPMVLRRDAQCEAVPPVPYSTNPTSPFYALAQEVYDTVRLLTPQQRIIARFWADDPGSTPTPPGHSLMVTTQVLQQVNASLALAAETYARVGIAVNDAFIGCWQTKYAYNRIRPLTFIHDHIDSMWNDPEVTDPVITPPFPEYTSGHSVQSGAVAEVLTSLWGDVTFTDRTHVTRGLLPRTYHSFWEMANEAAISRLYGGIHYRDAIEAGLVQGQCIGQQVSALQFQIQ